MILSTWSSIRGHLIYPCWGFHIVQTPEHTYSLPGRQWKIWAYRVLAQWVMKRREKCVRAQVLRCLREKSVHSMGSKRVREKGGKVKSHRMNLSLQYTEEMKQSILCSWAEPVDDDEPLQNFPAGHSTAALFIPVPKPSQLQPIILWQPSSMLLAAHSRLSLYSDIQGWRETTGDDLAIENIFKGTV